MYFPPIKESPGTSRWKAVPRRTIKRKEGKTPPRHLFVHKSGHREIRRHSGTLINQAGAFKVSQLYLKMLRNEQPELINHLGRGPGPHPGPDAERNGVARSDEHHSHYKHEIGVAR